GSDASSAAPLLVGLHDGPEMPTHCTPKSGLPGRFGPGNAALSCGFPSAGRTTASVPRLPNLEARLAAAGGRDYQGLFHRWIICPPQLDFDFVQLLRLRSLVIRLDEQLHGEGIVLVFFEVRYGFFVFFLIHQQGSGSALIRSLDHAIAAAVGQGFEILESLVSQRL